MPPEVLLTRRVLGGIEVRIERVRPWGGGEAIHRVVGEWTEGTDETTELVRRESYVRVPPSLAGAEHESAAVAAACMAEVARMLDAARAATGL
jgi:hypothetical protein